MNPLIYQIYGPVFGPRRGDLNPKSMCLGSMKMVKWPCVWMDLYSRGLWLNTHFATPSANIIFKNFSKTRPRQSIWNHQCHKSAKPLLAKWRLYTFRGLALHPSSSSSLCPTMGANDLAIKTKCRRCGYANETLSHVLCHCKPNFVAITKRHNAIQDRLMRAFNASASTTVRINP